MDGYFSDIRPVTMIDAEPIDVHYFIIDLDVTGMNSTFSDGPKVGGIVGNNDGYHNYSKIIIN